MDRRTDGGDAPALIAVSFEHESLLELFRYRQAARGQGTGSAEELTAGDGIDAAKP